VTEGSGRGGGSVHKAPGRGRRNRRLCINTIRPYEWATAVLFEVRKQRSEAKQPLKVPITKVTITAEAGAVALMP
jgi:hypothetical protein